MHSPESLEDTPFKLKVLNYSRNCSLPANSIPNLVKPLISVPTLVSTSLVKMPNLKIQILIEL